MRVEAFGDFVERSLLFITVSIVEINVVAAQSVANNAIDADNGSFWRYRFREKYAFKEGLPNKELRRVYQRRSKALRRGTALNFFRGYKRREQAALEVLRDLVVGKYISI